MLTTPSVARGRSQINLCLLQTKNRSRRSDPGISWCARRIRVVLQHLLFRFCEMDYTTPLFAILNTLFCYTKRNIIRNIRESFLLEKMKPILDAFISQLSPVERSLNYEINFILYKHGSVRTSLKWYKSEKCPELAGWLATNPPKI